MPLARLARPHAGERHVDRLVAEQRDEPLHRPTERRVARSPAHRLAERDLRGELRERLADELARIAPLLLAPAGEVTPGLLLPFGRLLHDLDLIDGDAELRRERLRGLRRLAVFVSRGLRRPDDLF